MVEYIHCSQSVTSGKKEKFIPGLQRFFYLAFLFVQNGSKSKTASW